jgi:hypothetical protein
VTTQRTSWAVYRTAAGLTIGPATEPVGLADAVRAAFPDEPLLKADDASGPAAHVADLCVVPVEDPATYRIEQAAAPAATGAGGMTVQSLLFPKDKWTAETARAWIGQHADDGLADHGVDETDDYYRFRQADPASFAEGSLRTIDFGADIRAIVGRPKAVKGVDPTVVALNDRLVFGGVQLLKADAPEEAEERYVLSVVMEPNDGVDAALDPDAEGDIQSAADIRKAAHRWMEHGGQIDLGHSWRALGNDRVRVLESYLCPADVEIGGYPVRKGTWLLALRMQDDKLWEAVKSGAIGAYSIGGSGTRTPVEDQP